MAGFIIGVVYLPCPLAGIKLQGETHAGTIANYHSRR